MNNGKRLVGSLEKEIHKCLVGRGRSLGVHWDLNSRKYGAFRIQRGATTSDILLHGLSSRATLCTNGLWLRTPSAPSPKRLKDPIGTASVNNGANNCCRISPVKPTHHPCPLPVGSSSLGFRFRQVLVLFKNSNKASSPRSKIPKV